MMLAPCCVTYRLGLILDMHGCAITVSHAPRDHGADDVVLHVHGDTRLESSVGGVSGERELPVSVVVLVQETSCLLPDVGVEPVPSGGHGWRRRPRRGHQRRGGFWAVALWGGKTGWKGADGCPPLYAGEEEEPKRCVVVT